ncbi:hypothetical protein HFD88_001953 [Aspergillus terreus]|nr:hypothetical protein HFD88_001953 [Aspergillus terreus]
MDSETPASLFKETTNIKSIKQDLSVYVSIGGWTFSDNNTATQPLFGEIAASESKRRTFAQNTVHFMQQYGFDGVDIDWEYPGAGDRGGKPEDTENYVLLLKTMREVFDKSGGDYGLTFTAPSSYWYLRWFDLEKMVKYVNWINVMTYDLHGVWDSENPIGSIVQGHTNLTEIKTALELFWRVDINPSKLVLGFGFYGRSFTLSDPECRYYEIMSILDGASGKKRAKITPTHDKDAAVNYFIFDDDQWVSYDDKTTFKQKVDWADTIGMGGAMIWASDLDDDKYSAHAGLTGKKIISTADLQTINKAISNPESVIDDLSAFDGQKCFKYDGKCVNLNDNEAMSRACGAGVSSDCSGQCQAGEININGIRSSWGGGPQNDGDTDKCGRGYKIFCCPDPDYNTAKSQCSYADCGQDCPAGKISVLTKYDNCWRQGQKYCCPIDTELKSCHWRGGSGGSDCANAKCNATEVQIDLATYGDKSKACDWGRSKAACCTITKAPVRKATCSTNLCSLMDEFCLDDGGERHFDKRQAVGVGGGAAPATLGLRLAEAFGSTRNRYPFLPTWKQLNLAKGRALRLESPVSIESIRTSVRRALQSDTNEDVDALFSKIQMGLAAFQYMQEPGYHARFSNVHQEMYRQLYYGEQAWGQDGLQDWWEAWSADHLEQVARMAQDWAREALGEVWSGYLQARIAGRHLQTYDSVVQQLLEWEDEIAKLYVPKPASVRFRNPDNGEGPSNS